MTELDLPEADVLKALNEVTAAHREALMVIEARREPHRRSGISLG